MIRSKVKSSQIEAVGYDADAQILEVEFKGKKNNSLYHYFKVDADTAAQFMAAESLGKFLGGVIKPKFEFKKIAIVKADGTEEEIVP